LLGCDYIVTLPNYAAPIGATEKPSIRQCACLLFGKFRENLLKLIEVHVFYFPFGLLQIPPSSLFRNICAIVPHT
jgi:hypothetical protein